MEHIFTHRCGLYTMTLVRRRYFLLARPFLIDAAEIYPDPEVFDGFRFSKLRESEESGSAKYQVITTTLDYLPFGHGRHACPGRFFAAVVGFFSRRRFIASHM
jgi:hypothetical protein